MEMRSVEEASNAMALDGIIFEVSYLFLLLFMSVNHYDLAVLIIAYVESRELLSR